MTIPNNPIETFFSIPTAYFPKASPDGEWVACNWNTTGRFELHGTHLPTGRRHQFTDGEIPLHPENVSYVWAADSEAVLYRGAEENTSWVYRSPVEGEKERLFSIPEDGLLWAVNPVSGLIYYRVDDTTLRWRNPTTDEYGDFPQFPGLDTQIAATCAVSPDGEFVAYSSNPPQTNTAETTFVSGLTTYITRADGSDPVRVDVPDHGKRLTPVQWHPHEHKLLVERDDGHWRDGRTCGIYDINDESVEWIADMGAVAFLHDGDTILSGAPPRSATAVIDTKGDVTDIPCEGLFLDCSGTEATIGGNEFVLQRSKEDRPYEALYHNLVTEETTVLFGAGYEDREIGPDEFVEPTEIQFPLPDGETAGGLLYRPSERDGETPAIVFFYGMSNTWSRSFRPEVQLLVHLGYTVLLANCPVPGWTPEEHDIFNAAGSWLRDQEGIASDSVAAYGHSHGGYNVYMQAVLHPNTWDAFVADTGVVDLRQITLGNLRRQLGDPDENRAEYEAMSPITHMDGEVGSPLLMIHGEEDSNAEQPRIFERALQNRGWSKGDEYDYIEVQGMGHKPKSRVKQTVCWKAIIEFLDYHFA